MNSYTISGYYFVEFSRDSYEIVEMLLGFGALCEAQFQFDSNLQSIVDKQFHSVSNWNTASNDKNSFSGFLNKYIHVSRI